MKEYEDGDYEAALEDWSYVLKLNQMSVLAHNGVAKAYYNAENYDDAITYLLRAYEYNNQNGEALYNLGNSYRLNEQSVEAVEIYRKVTANFAGTEKARRSAQYIEELTGAEE